MCLCLFKNNSLKILHSWSTELLSNLLVKFRTYMYVIVNMWWCSRDIYIRHNDIFRLPCLFFSRHFVAPEEKFPFRVPWDCCLRFKKDVFSFKMLIWILCFWFWKPLSVIAWGYYCNRNTKTKKQSICY